jgi:hypothetical protein
MSLPGFAAVMVVLAKMANQVVQVGPEKMGGEAATADPAKTVDPAVMAAPEGPAGKAGAGGKAGRGGSGHGDGSPGRPGKPGAPRSGKLPAPEGHGRLMQVAVSVGQSEQ